VPQIQVTEGLPVENATRLHALFAGHPDARGTHGQPELDSNGIKWAIKTSAKTLREAVTTQHWEKHIKGEEPLGIVPIRPDNSCIWGSIDYDQYDDDILPIIAAVESHDMPLVPCRSKSGGLHLFIFLSDPQPAAAVQAVLREFAARLGIAGSEIFPKQTQILADRGDLGNWMVMPYFGGDYGGKLRMQHGLTRTGDEYSLEEFLEIAEAKRISAEDFTALTRTRRRGRRSREQPFPLFTDGPPCLENLATSGFPDGARNNGLFMVGLYLKKRAPGTWQRDLEEANHQFMKPPLLADEVQAVVRQLERKDYEYTCHVEPMCSHCDKALCRTRKHGISSGGYWPTISSISKMESETILWFVNVDGVRLECTTDQLLNYAQFNKLCVDKMDRCYLPMKVGDWNGQINKALEAVETIPAPPGMGPGEYFKFLLKEFLTNRMRAQRREDLQNGKPWYDDELDRYYFSFEALTSWLRKERHTEIKDAKIRSEIVDRMSGGSRQINFGARNLHMWWVPSRAFDVDPPKKDDKKDPC